MSRTPAAKSGDPSPGAAREILPTLPGFVVRSATGYGRGVLVTSTITTKGADMTTTEQPRELRSTGIGALAAPVTGYVAFVLAMVSGEYFLLEHHVATEPRPRSQLG